MSQPPLNIPDYRPKPQAAVVPDLSTDQLQEVAAARQRGKKLRRAVATAKIDGGITAFFAIVCVMSFCMGWEGPVLGVVMGVIASNSFRGAAKLARFDPAAPMLLAMNQLYLATAIILYAVYELYAGLSGPNAGHLTELAGLGDMGKDFANLERSMVWLVYISLIVGTVVAQGLTGLYYYTRLKLLREYLQNTPPWVQQLLVASA